jgi:hypothetical protein
MNKGRNFVARSFSIVPDMKSIPSAVVRVHATTFRPQYSLRTLLWGVSALGALFATMTWVGALWSWAIVLFGLLVAAHVGGNWIGTRLRDEATIDAEHDASRPISLSPSLDATGAGLAARRAIVSETGPTQLQARRSLGWTIPVVCVAGGVLCAAVAAIALASLQGPSVSIWALLLGTASGGVIGGIWGFLGASFWRAASLALDEASRGSRPTSRPGPSTLAAGRRPTA